MACVETARPRGVIIKLIDVEILAVRPSNCRPFVKMPSPLFYDNCISVWLDNNIRDIFSLIQKPINRDRPAENSIYEVHLLDGVGYLLIEVYYSIIIIFESETNLSFLFKSEKNLR